MPINRGNHISAMIEEVLWVNPLSILDVGMGWGMMGVIFRAFTDIRKLHLKDWDVQIDGIEIFEPYRNDNWNNYTNVYIGDALTEIEKLKKYDLVYCGDMIEHLTKEDGHKLIEKMLEHCNQWLYIATPTPTPKQETVLGNPAETHLSSWTIDDFKNYNYEFVANAGFGGAYMLLVRIKK